MQKTLSVVRHKQTALLSHREAVGKKLAGPCLKAFQGYLPPRETRNTRETIYIQSACSYRFRLKRVTERRERDHLYLLGAHRPAWNPKVPIGHLLEVFLA